MISSIPFTAPIAPTPHGLLASPYWWTWLAYLMVLPLAWCLMPGQLRESAKTLWAPVGRWIARLSAPWLWVSLFALSVCLCVLEPHLCWWWGIWPMIEIREQRRRLAFRGFGELGRT